MTRQSALLAFHKYAIAAVLLLTVAVPVHHPPVEGGRLTSRGNGSMTYDIDRQGTHGIAVEARADNIDFGVDWDVEQGDPDADFAKLLSPFEQHSPDGMDIDSPDLQPAPQGRPWTRTCAGDILHKLAAKGQHFLQAGIEDTIEGLDTRLKGLPKFGHDPLMGAHEPDHWQRPPAHHWTIFGIKGWQLHPYDTRPEFATSWPGMNRVLRGFRVGQHVNDPDSKPWLLPRHVNPDVLSWAHPYASTNGPNIAVGLRQGGAWRDCTSLQHEATEATLAFYMNIYNVLDGVLIVQNAEGPAHMLQQRLGRAPTANELPNMSHWSDVTWWLWKQLHDRSNNKWPKTWPSPTSFQAMLPPRGPRPGANPPSNAQEINPAVGSSQDAASRTHDGNRKQKTNENGGLWLKVQDIAEMTSFLNYVVIQSINTDQTKEVIASCLKARGWVLGANRRYGPVWGEHETFPIGHWCFYALLATPMNKGIAWLLMQHKADKALGMKMLKSVTIVYGDSKGHSLHERAVAQAPSVVWQVVDASDEVKLLKQQTEAHGVGMHYWWDDLPAIPYPRYE